jgi:hypothetical protein
MLDQQMYSFKHCPFCFRVVILYFMRRFNLPIGTAFALLIFFFFFVVSLSYLCQCVLRVESNL